jgi:hypothetical protein
VLVRIEEFTPVAAHQSKGSNDSVGVSHVTMSKFLRWLRERFRRRDEKSRRHRVEFIAEGFAVVLPNGARAVVEWASVTKVVTSKIDLFSYDEIFIAFEMSERQGTRQEVWESWDGFEALLEPLERELGLSRDWYGSVLHPAFAENHRVLFERGVDSRESARRPSV